MGTCSGLTMLQYILMDTPTVLRWSAYEHEHIERTPDWYWALGIVTAAVVIICILLHNVLFAVVIVLAATAIALHSRVEPHPATFEISDRGIRTNGMLHRWNEIISFYVEEEGVERPLLLVDTTKWMSPNLIIPIEHIEPSVGRAYLRERCREVHMHEPWAHQILAFFGF